MSSPVGLELPGSLAVTKVSLADVGTSMSQTVQFAVAVADRTKADGFVSFAFFIQADLDLNALVSYEASGTGLDVDDAYALAAATVTSANAVNELRNLPASTNVAIDAGLVDAQDPSSNSLRQFPVTLTVSVDANGDMTSSIAISGEDVLATATDDAHKAQKVHWTGIETTPSVAANDADILSSNLSSSALETYFSTELAAINGQYNGQNMIASWTISLSAISLGTSHKLAQHARHHGFRGVATPLFSADDKIVVDTPFSYSVAITDYTDASQTVVSAQNVFGVLKQPAA